VASRALHRDNWTVSSQLAHEVDNVIDTAFIGCKDCGVEQVAGDSREVGFVRIGGCEDGAEDLRGRFAPRGVKVEIGKLKV
jgi:hypothetical protein